MTGRLRTSRAGLELIKSFEGFRDGAIRLPDGRWTIGYGHVRSAREGLIISQKDAEDLLVHDLGVIESAINSLVFTPLNQNQFDALVSLVFNI
jgi:GH24 family phage-related lysozyme (muramidase)